MTLVQQQKEPTSIKIRTTNIKKVYVWTNQVRPSEIWSFSYDFTTWSVADLQSKWWTVPSWSIINSNGYYNQSRNRNLITYSSAELTSALQNAKSMTMSLTWYSTGESQRVRGIKHTWGQETIFYGDCVTANYGNQALFAGESLVSTDGNVYGSVWTYTTTLSADLVNKTWEYKWNPSDQTGTLTNTAINYFKAWGNLEVYAEAWNGQTIYIKNVSIIIY